MVAYFALASFVPLIFLALAILGYLNQADASSALVRYLEAVFPSQSVDSITRVTSAIKSNRTTLSIVGLVALLGARCRLFSALESAFNIIYDTEPGLPARQGTCDRLHGDPRCSSSSSD